MSGPQLERTAIDPYLQNKIFALFQVLLAVATVFITYFSIQSLFAAALSLAALLVIGSALYKAQNSRVSPFLIQCSWCLLLFANLWATHIQGQIIGALFLLFAIGFGVFQKRYLWVALALTCLIQVVSYFSIASVMESLVLVIFAALCSGIRDALEQGSINLGVVSQQDPSTGLLSSTALNTEMKRALRLYERYDTPCSIVAIEFRASEVKDMAAEKQVVQALIHVWQSRLRQTDILFRLSDARFVALLPSTSAEQASGLLEDLERSSQAYEIPVSLEFDLKFSVADCSTQESAEVWLENVCTGLAH